MNTLKLLLIAACAALTLSAGCAGDKQVKAKAVEPVCVADVNKAQAMQAGEDVLGKMHFTVEKADADMGYIRTRPLQGAQFFELWRNDVVGGANWAESNIQNIRRTVELNITGQQGQICYSCNVKTQRLSLSDYKDTKHSQAYDRFESSGIRSTKQRVDLGSAQQKTWIDLGQDEKLATVILQRIEKQIAEQQKRKGL
jgi:hypothetical protein